MMTIKRKNIVPILLIYTILIPASLMVIIPVLWMLSTSVKSMEEMFTLPPRWIPDQLTWKAFLRIWNDYPFGRYFANSLIVVSAATVISLIFSALAGYGASRFRFRGKGTFLTFLLVTQMFPSIMLLIPYFKVMKTLGLINTYPGLILCYISFTIPFCSWMMLGYFQSIHQPSFRFAVWDCMIIATRRTIPFTTCSHHVLRFLSIFRMFVMIPTSPS
jgi:ABC-type glycerol-3-phosphate transport system permease component